MQRNQINHRSARTIEVGGEIMCASAAARHLGMPLSTFYSRLYRGWSDDCAVRTSNDKCKPHRAELRRAELRA